MGFAAGQRACSQLKRGGVARTVPPCGGNGSPRHGSPSWSSNWQPGYAAIHIGLIHCERASVDKEPGARNLVAQRTGRLYNRGGICADQPFCAATQGRRCCPRGENDLHLWWLSGTSAGAEDSR